MVMTLKVCEVQQRGVKDLNWFLTEVYIRHSQTSVMELFLRKKRLTANLQRRIEILAKQLIWRVLRKQLTAKYASAVAQREEKPI